MPRKCAFGCKYTGITFHLFPNPDKDPERFRAWVDSVNGRLDTPSDYEYFRKKRVCDLHFKDHDRNRFNRLNALAVPSPIRHSTPEPEISQQVITNMPDPVPSTSCIPKPKSYASQPVIGNQPNPVPSRSLEHLASSAVAQVTKMTTKPAQIFKRMQLKGCKKKTKRRRFILLKKVMSLYKRSPKCYSVLSKHQRQCNDYCQRFKFNQVQQCCLVESYRQSGLEGLATKSRIIACRKHYNTEDFHVMLEKCRKTQKDVDVLPTAMDDTNDHADADNVDDNDVDNVDDDVDNDDDDQIHQDSEILDDIKVCRVCLELDVKMYDIKDFKLGEMFQSVTGIAVAASNHSVLERVCWECAARLKAAATFRDKALLSDTLLQELVKTGNHIQKNDIMSIKDNHSNLKSSLTIRKIFYTKNVNENKPDELPENKDTKTKIKKELESSILKKLLSNNEMEVDESGPLIDVPIDTEMAPDPLYCNKKTEDIFILEVTPLDTGDREENRREEETLIEDCEDIITKHELKIENWDTISNAVYKNNNERKKLTIINDNGHTYLKEDKVKTKPVKCNKLGGVGKRISSDKNTVESAPIRIKIASKTGVMAKTMNDNPARIDEDTKQRIISLKRKGVPDVGISHRLGVTHETIRMWWERWCKEHHIKCHVPSDCRRTTTAQDATPSVHTPSLAQEYALSTRTARMRLREAGFKSIPRKTIMPQRSGHRYKLDEETKKQIILLKKAGLCVGDISKQLGVTGTSVYLWWRRWCHDNKIPIGDRRRNKKAIRNQGLMENINEEETSHTQTVPASQKTTWERLPY